MNGAFISSSNSILNDGNYWNHSHIAKIDIINEPIALINNAVMKTLRVS